MYKIAHPQVLGNPKYTFTLQIMMGIAQTVDSLLQWTPAAIKASSSSR